METINKVVDAVQTPNGLIVFLVILVSTFLFLIIITAFNLEITFKPFSIKRTKGIKEKKNLSQFDIDFLVNLIKDAYSLFEANTENIHKEYKEKVELSSKHCIGILVNNIILEYVDLLKKGEKTFDADQRDILELYLERDINEIILNALRQFYDKDLTQPQVEVLIENSIHSIIVELKAKLLKYRLIKDTTSLKSIYNDSSKFIASSLRDAFKDFSNYAKEERAEIEELLSSHNERLNDQIRNYLRGDIDTDGNKC